MNAGSLRIIFLSFFVVIAARTQQTTEPTGDRNIRVSVDVVQIDAIVTDARGHRVADLKASDFELLVDGRPRTISYFSYVEGTAPTIQTTATMAGISQAESHNGLPVAPAQPLAREGLHRTIVMIADDLALASDDIPKIRVAMKGFIDSQMRDGDLVSVMTTSGGVGALEQLTNDKRQLYASIERIRYVPGRVGQTWYEPTNIGDAAREVETDSKRRLQAVRAPTTVMDSFGAVSFAIQGLSRIGDCAVLRGLSSISKTTHSSRKPRIRRSLYF